MLSGASREVMCQAVLMLIVLVAILLADAAWVYLLAGHGMFWRTDQLLPAEPVPAAWPDVVAVIPARNEAAILPQTLPTLLTQEYQGQLTVLLVDDESSDGTADVAAALGAARPGRLRVIAGQPAPAGWAGKVWAMAQGLRAAGGAELVLFTDADIAYAPGALSALVRAAGGRALVSQMALLRTDATAERLLIPAFVYFFAQLFPFRRVNKRGKRTAAAAGGCMLVRRRALEAAGGLGPIRGARIDDVALGALLKSAGGDCWLGFSADVVSRRPYSGVAEIWDMVARSAYTQLRYSPVVLAGTVAGMAILYLLPAAAALAGLVLLSGWLCVAGFGAWVIMSVTYVPVLRLYRLSPVRAVCLPVIGALYTAMTISSASRYYAGQGGEWKGRTIVASGQ
jgi:hopene-associated glycosyltransferase HpnB